MEDDEVVRAWLLSNPVLEDPHHLLIYCHRPNHISKEPTLALRGHPYLPPGSVDRWSNECYTREMLCGGEFDPDRRRPDARADPELANEADAPQGGDGTDALLGALSSMSSDVSGAGDGHVGSIKMLSSPSGERMESHAKRIPLALISLSQLNIQQSAELGQCPAQGDMRRKCRGLIDDQNCDESRSKRFRLMSMAREYKATEEARKRSASFDNEESHKRNPKRFRLSLASESLMDLTGRLSFAEST